MQTRRLLFQLHRYIGLAATAFLLIAAATGCLLVFRDSLDAALNPDLFGAPAGGAALPVGKLVARVEQAHPGWRVLSAPVAPPRGESARLIVASRDGRPLGFDQAFVDPGSGAVLGVRATRAGWGRRDLMQGVYLLHYTLLAGTPGRWLMGVVAAGWCLTNLIGLWLTLPHGRVWPRWRRAWSVTFSRGLQRALISLHQATGLWLFGGVMVLALTSVAMNFYGEAFRPAMMAISPPQPSPFDHPPAPGSASHPVRLGFGEAARRAVQVAPALDPGLKPAAITLIPERGLYWVQLTRSGQVSFSGLGPVGVYFDTADGRLVYVDRPFHDSAGAMALRALYPLHSGQVGGLATRWLYLVLGLAVIEMTLTGLIAWARKQASHLRRRRSTPQAMGLDSENDYH